MKSCVAVGKHLAAVRGSRRSAMQEEEEEMQWRQMCCRFFGLWGGLNAQCVSGGEGGACWGG